MGGEKLSTNLRPGCDSNGFAAARDFRHIAQPAIPSEISASPIQIASHRDCEVSLDAKAAAASAVSPIPTPPHPGTAVKADAPSMVSRIYRRLSIALVCKAGGSSIAARIGRTQPIDSRLKSDRSDVKYFSLQSIGHMQRILYCK